MRFALLAATLIGNLLTINMVAQQNNLTLENIWKNGAFSVNRPQQVKMLPDGETYSRLVSNKNGSAIVMQRYAEIEDADTVFNQQVHFANAPADFRLSDYEIDLNNRFLLLASNEERVYRYSTRGIYYLFDRQAGTTRPLLTGTEKVSHATFDPTGRYVSYILANNLYLQDLTTGTTTAVTTDGAWNEVINGMCDWVYEEEFGFTKAYAWSADGSRIAWLRFDESQVPQVSLPIYGSLYPEMMTFKYPKAGDANSKVSVHVRLVGSKANVQLASGAEADAYFARLGWAGETNNLCVTRLNRLQNEIELIVHTDVGRGKMAPQTIYKAQSETYIEVHDNLHFTRDGQRWFWTSERGGYNQLYTATLSDTSLVLLTPEQEDLAAVYGLDEKEMYVYYTAMANHGTERYVYRTAWKAAGNKSRKAMRQLLVNKPGYHSPTFAPKCAYFYNEWSDAQTAPNFTLHLASGKTVAVLERNEELNEKLKSLSLSYKTFGRMKNEQGTELNYWHIPARNVDPGEKAPVLMFVYGGPGSNTVQNSFGGLQYLWFELMAEKGYHVFSVDPRGTQYQGRDFKRTTYRQLGKYELEDVAAAADFVRAMPGIDGERLGIFGWSYGGYMSSLAMMRTPGTFKAGIAVAPVSNWRFYDTIYTERYMRTPQENGTGYDENSPLTYADQLEGAYLLVHGTADDNVHPQNAYELSMALVAANKPFEQMMYPNRNHGIYGGNTRLHLFTKLTDFINREL